MQPTPGPMPGTSEWLEVRKTCVGASDGAAVMGLSRYRTALELYLVKRGLNDDPEENAAMRLGKAMEPVVKSEFTQRTGWQLGGSMAMHFHPEFPFISATPDDDVLEPGYAFLERPLLECKTTNWRTAKALIEQGELGEEMTDQIPSDWLIQCQQQMFVMNRSKCYLAALIDARTLKLYVVQRNEDLIQQLVSALTEFWGRVQQGLPPAPDWSHQSTLGLVKRMFGEDDTPITLTDEQVTYWMDYQRLGSSLRALQERRDELQAKLLYSLGDATRALFPRGTVELIRKDVIRKEHVVKASVSPRLYERKVVS